MESKFLQACISVTKKYNVYDENLVYFEYAYVKNFKSNHAIVFNQAEYAGHTGSLDVQQFLEIKHKLFFKIVEAVMKLERTGASSKLVANCMKTMVAEN